MNRYVKAVLWAIPPILFLVIIPRLVLGMITQAFPNAQTTVSQDTGFDLASFVTGLNIIGIALAVLSALQTWAYKWSIIKPASSALHMIVSFVLMLYVIGLGNPSTLGVTNLTYLSSGTSGNLDVTLSLTLTFLTVMIGAAVALKIIQKTMKWREDVGFHHLDLQTAAQASQPSSTGPSPR